VRQGTGWTVERHQPAAWLLPWLRSRWRCGHRRADLGCQAANAGSTGGARRVLAGRLVVVAIEDVRTPSVPFVCSLSASLPVRHGVPGGVDGVRPDTTGRRCPNACPIVASMVDAGHDRADIGPDQARGRSGIEHECRCHDGRIPLLVAAGVGRREHAHCRLIRSGARTCKPRGWPWPADRTHGRTLGAGGVRGLAAAVRTGSVPIG
jgi:hypothetical protein